MKKSKIIAILIVICLSFSAVAYAKYTTTIDSGSISLQINAKVQNYEIPLVVDNSKLFVRDKFISGLISDRDYIYTTSNDDKDFQINSQGIHINDNSADTAFWCYIPFVHENGYTSALNPNHIYYARCSVKIVSVGSEGYFSFAFANARHKIGGVIKTHGVPTNNVKLETVTSDFAIMSIRDKPRLSIESENTSGEILEPGTTDCLQFGSSATGILDVYIKNILMFDLTEIFGAGNEPPQSWCDENIAIETSELSWLSKP